MEEEQVQRELPGGVYDSDRNKAQWNYVLTVDGAYSERSPGIDPAIHKQDFRIGNSEIQGLCSTVHDEED